MLNEAQLEELKVKYSKIGVVEFNGHQLVFRRPTRDDCREYRRQRESPSEKHEATEHLSQKVIVAFDGELDVIKARTFYTSTFLEEFPLFTSTTKVQAALGTLAGLVEDEDAQDLGKGVQIRSVRPPALPRA